MKMTFLWLGFLCLCLNVTHAQENLQVQIKAVFDPIDKISMQSEFLLDQGFHLFDLNVFNGQSTSDSIATNPASATLLYSGLMTSREYDYNIYPTIDDIESLQSTYLNIEQIPIGLVNMRIDKLNDVAIEVGDIYKQNDRLYNVANPSTNLFELTRSVFLMPGISEITAPNPEFIIPSDLYISDNPILPTLEIKGTEQVNYAPLNFDQPFSINGLQSGENIITLRITDGPNIFLARVRLTYEIPPTSNASRVYDPKAVHIDQFVSGVQGIDLYVYYDREDTDCGTSQITKPLIFVEGFDPNNIIGISAFDEIVGKDYILPSKSTTLREEFEKAGYDLIFVNWQVAGPTCDGVPQYIGNNGEASMFENVERVKNVIRWVNQQKEEAGSNEENVLIGASMGGVVSKLALLQMEAENEDHENRIFVTLDSPLKGANIPLGLQALVYDFNELSIAGIKLKSVKGIGQSLQNALHTITSPAATQQIYYHYGSELAGQSLSAWHDAFYDVLESYGDLEVEHLAISNGAKNGEGQQYQAGELLLYYSLTETTVPSDNILVQLGLALADHVVDLELIAEIWAYEDNGQPIYRRNVRYTLKNGSPVSVTLNYPFQYNAPPGLLALDSAPGGMRPFNRVAEGPSSADGSGTCPAPKGFGLPFLYAGYCFVPSISALDSDETDPYFDFSNNQGSGGDAAGSDFYMGPSEALFTWPLEIENPAPNNTLQVNEEHVWPTNENMNFLVFGALEDESFNEISNISELTYNFGKINQDLWDQFDGALVRRSTTRKIDHDVTISGNGRLWVNKDGPIGFTNQSNALTSQENDEFIVQVHNNCDNLTTITIEDNGRIEVGEPGQNEHGELIFNEGTQMMVHGNGQVKINDNSTMRIKSTARVTFDTGSKLIARKGKIIVENGGFLSINQDSDLIASYGGNIKIEDGGILHINGANVNLHAPNGFLDIEGEFHIENSFDFISAGRINFHDTHTLTIDNGWTFEGSNKFDNNIKLEGETTLKIEGNDFNLKRTTVTYSSNASIKMTGGTFNGTAVVFDSEGQNVRALDLIGLSEVNTLLCDFKDFQTGISVQDYNGPDPVSLQLSDYTNCVTAIELGGVPKTKLNDVDITGSEIGLIAGQADFISLRGCEFQSTSGAFGAYLLDVEAFYMTNSTINDWDIGIYCPQDATANIFLHTNAILENNNIGVHITKGHTNGTQTDGLVLADCARFINNGTAISGEDLQLKVDAIENCGNCPTEEIAPNHFIAPNNGLIFDLCFVDNDNDHLSARGNFWGGAQPTNYDLIFKVNHAEMATGCSPISNLITDASQPFLSEQSCGGFNGPEVPTNDPTGLTDCDIIVGAKGGATAFQNFNLGYSYFRNGQFTNALPRFQTVANVNQSTRNGGDFICRHYVDVSRVFAQALQTGGFETLGNEDPVEFTDPQNHAIQAKPTENDVLRITPNPADDQMNISYNVAFDGNANIYNSFGQLVWSRPMERSIHLNIYDWTSGVYYFVLKSKTGQSIETEKFIVH